MPADQLTRRPVEVAHVRRDRVADYADMHATRRRTSSTTSHARESRTTGSCGTTTFSSPPTTRSGRGHLPCRRIRVPHARADEVVDRACARASREVDARRMLAEGRTLADVWHELRVL